MHIYQNFTGGVSVAGGNSGLDNTAYAGPVIVATGSFTPAFGIEYTGSTLYGYSPDPDFVQSTVINATLNGANGGTTAWSLLGGLGDDSIIGGNNNDTAFGGEGTDSIFGGDGLDTLFGEAGNDTIDGGLGNDSISGGVDNDSLLGSAGDDTFDGGTGTDTFFFGKTGIADLTYLTATTSVVGGLGVDTIQFADGNVNVADSAYTLVSQIESIVGGSGNDTFSFGTNATALADLAGVLGGSGNDSLVLESTYNSATNPITLDGGLGNDIFSINSYSQIQPVGNSTFIGGGGTDTLAFATAVGTVGAPAVIDDANAQSIEILQLADDGVNTNYLVVNGGFGIDTIIGGSGVSNNINAGGLGIGNSVALIGGSASDTLIGGPAGDRLQGFATSAFAPVTTGSDSLTGGADIDTFVLGNAAGSAYTGSANAGVIDFDIFTGSADIFELFTNGAAVAGGLPTSFVQSGGAGTPWEIRDGGGTAVYSIGFNDGTRTGTITIDPTGASNVIADFNYLAGQSGNSFTATNFRLV